MTKVGLCMNARCLTKHIEEIRILLVSLDQNFEKQDE